MTAVQTLLNHIQSVKTISIIATSRPSLISSLHFHKKNLSEKSSKQFYSTSSRLVHSIYCSKIKIGTCYYTTSSDVTDKIGRLILVRHGQSIWNVTCPIAGTTARFTGWADIGLTNLGYEQAVASGKAIKSFLVDNSWGDDSKIDAVYCSLLSRAKDTMNLALKELDLLEDWKIANLHQNTNAIVPITNCSYKVPVITSWRLNERHYGSLVGLSKDGAERLYGKEQLSKWRNGWDIAPPPMEMNQLRKWMNLNHTRAATVVKNKSNRKNALPINGESNADYVNSSNDREYTIIEKGPFYKYETFDDGDNTTARVTINDFASLLEKGINEPTVNEPIVVQDNYQELNSNNMPASESLSDTCRRILPIFEGGIAPRLRMGETVVVFAHANTIRSILYHIDPHEVTQLTMKKVKIPSAVPLLYLFKKGKKEANREESNKRVPVIPVPGGLELIRRIDNQSDEKISDAETVQLNGQWLRNKEVEKLSFCSPIGQKNLEHEIA